VDGLLGYGQRTTCPHMPRIIYTPGAIADLVRLRDFLKTKNLDAAKRAVSTMKADIEKAAINPERYRPVPDLPHYREIIIDFGSSGYIARFRHAPGQDVVIVRIKHQLENDFPPDLA
jgi:plasmid stabilization system protein ParE